MSSPTQPMTGLARSTAHTPSPALASQLARDEQASPIDVSRAAPPSEVLDEMARADDANRRLRESGHEIIFSVGEGSTAIELRDHLGSLLRTLSVGEVAEIAAGGSVE